MQTNADTLEGTKPGLSFVHNDPIQNLLWIHMSQDMSNLNTNTLHNYMWVHVFPAPILANGQPGMLGIFTQQQLTVYAALTLSIKQRSYGKRNPNSCADLGCTADPMLISISAARRFHSVYVKVGGLGFRSRVQDLAST